ncbi:hypothetical protein Tsubulata_019358 [Turnera subulata]|uniref:Protein SWEETIE n=1 Tax=Turnera subulata TaxID=218843 RepID=A0A9Q0JP63_9ROSI|nr:hypothetical protein Tsubulata_019358 [Turnera subulata]
MPPKTYARDNVPLSRFGILVAQLESIVASASHKSPDPLLCFDLISDLISAIEEEPKDAILISQRKCEDALYSLLVLGARRPVRHLASVAMAKVIYKGDNISIYSRASSLQGFLSDVKKSEPQKVAGAAQCLGELYRYFGRKITSGLLETTNIATKLMKSNEEFVRQEALIMLQKALEGCGGGANAAAYAEAFRLVTRSGIGDKSSVVRIAAARCLKAFANIGGPGLGVAGLDTSAYHCIKAGCAFEDPVSSVRDAFAEALGSLLALGVQPRGKGPFPPAKKLEGGLHRHFALPFMKASGTRCKDLRIGITFSWISFLQAIRLKYLHPDSELQNYALQVMEMLRADTCADAHALACVLYILRVGVTDQMTEPTQRAFLVFLGKQLESPNITPPMRIAALRILSYTLKTLGEVPLEFKEVFDNTIVAAVSHSSQLVRVEAALTLRALAEVDPTCVGGLISYGVTTLSALRDNVRYGKGSNLKFELDSLHGQAVVLAALVSISPKLPLGYPARLPKLVLELSKKMLTESGRNPVAAVVEKEAGWLLLSALLYSMPKQELEDQVFDILTLWASLFSGNPENEIKQTGDLVSSVSVWAGAVDALTAFVKCFISTNAMDTGVLIQPVTVYLSSALSYIMLLRGKELATIKPAVDVLIIRTLMAYQSLPDPIAFKSDHPQIVQLCTIPFRDAQRCEESSCLRSLLDKRDAWLGPWIPGRDWFEDELRSFGGGKDGLMPCVWENDTLSFPQPETISQALVNQMLLCFGMMFAFQDTAGKLMLLGQIEQCLKAGKKQTWRAANVTNICVALLAGFKALIALRPQPLGPEILNSAQAIFQDILGEGDICASQRRASSEGLGLLARLGNDIFTARMTRLLLGDLTGATDSNYAGSIAFSLGCIHRSAGGMALSSLVPATVSSISLLAKSTISGLQIWSLHGLLLTIEASGFSYVSHVQATLGLAMDILLSEEIGLIDLQQGVAHLINAIVAVLGPELAPGSIFFSRCKSVIAEISSRQETATLLESVRFTQQLVLFAPQAVSVHSHVQTLLPTLSSKQPTLRHLAVSTLRHLIEKDPVSIIAEQIEDNLFHMLDEETDSEIGKLVRATILRLLLASCPSCPSHWLLICRNMVLAISAGRDVGTGKGSGNNPLNGAESDSRLNFGEDDENMVSSSKTMPEQGYTFEASEVKNSRDKHLRYRTRVFAAECLSHLPVAVGLNPAHFDLSLARKSPANGTSSGDWLVLHLQELISLAYQISTIQFESMRPIGVGLLSTVLDKFETVPDPELPGHLLLEQYQAQLVSAVRTALDASSGPILLEAGLQLATKIMTSGILGGDQAAVKRIFSLISRPLNDFKDVYYPSFAEWVSCKIKIRLLAAHASLKCYTFAFLRRHHSGVPDEYLALLPLFSKSSSILGKYWIGVLKDFCYICLCLNLRKKRNPFLDGIQSPSVSSRLQPILEEAWPLILQALALDAVPANIDGHDKTTSDSVSKNSLISGYNMVELELEEYQFLWGFALLVLFQRQHPALSRQIVPLSSLEVRPGVDSPTGDTNPTSLKLYEVVLPVFQFLSSERFFTANFLTVDVCHELLQVFSYATDMDNSWNSLAISVLLQIVQNCPTDFLDADNFGHLAMELLLVYIFKLFQRDDSFSSDSSNVDDLISPLFITAKLLMAHFETRIEVQLKSMVVALLLLGYKCIGEALTELCFSTVKDFVRCTTPLLKKLFHDCCKGDDDGNHIMAIFGSCLSSISDLSKGCIKGIHLLDNKRSNLRHLLQLKLSFCLEEILSFAKLAYEFECTQESKSHNSICLTILKYCSKCVHIILSDSHLQVKAIGLQVLKTMVQRSTNNDDSAFLVFFCGELVTDILSTVQTMLKKPMSKESVVITGECLKFLLLLQTLSKGSESQRGFTNLLLKAIMMVFVASEDDSSREVNDARTTAVTLVSHLAQIPSAAIHFKDILLSMPATSRQQLQGVIRASVTKDQSGTSMKPTTPLEIKLPVPKDPQQSTMSLPLKEESGQKSSPVPSASVHSDQDSMEDSQEDEDDWDAFQSFPVTDSATTVPNVESATEQGAIEKFVVETNSESNFAGFTQSNQEDIRKVADDEKLISVSPTGVESKNSTSELYVDQLENRQEDAVPSHESAEKTVSSEGNVDSDFRRIHDSEGLAEGNVEEMEDNEQRYGNPGSDNALQVSSDNIQHIESKEPIEGADDKDDTPDDKNGSSAPLGNVDKDPDQKTKDDDAEEEADRDEHMEAKDEILEGMDQTGNGHRKSNVDSSESHETLNEEDADSKADGDDTEEKTMDKK